MSGNYALVKNNIVENIIVADDSFTMDGYTIVPIANQGVSMGDSWDGEKFTRTLPTLDTIEEPVDQEKVAIMEAMIAFEGRLSALENK